jgi:hypothetical protein
MANYMEVSQNGGTPKSFKSLDHDLVRKRMVTWGCTVLRNLHMDYIWIVYGVHTVSPLYPNDYFSISHIFLYK